MPPHRNLTNNIAELAALYVLDDSCAAGACAADTLARFESSLQTPTSSQSGFDRSAFERHLEEGCPVCEAEVRECREILLRWARQMELPPPASLREKLIQNMRAYPIPAEPIPSPVLLDQSGLLLLRTPTMEWLSGPTPGVSVKVMADDPQNDMSTMLVRMAPDSSYPSHRHKGVEEVYILAGELRVEGVDLREGDFCVSRPESVHQSSYSKSGCLLVVRTSKRDEVLV